MDEELYFEDIFKALIEETKNIEIVFDYVVSYYKDDAYANYQIKTINGEYPFSFKRKIQTLGKQGLTILSDEVSKIDYEYRANYLENIKDELLGLKNIVKDDEMVTEESERGPREVYKFKSFRDVKLTPFNPEKTKGHDKSILKKASEYVQDYLDSIDEIARKIDFMINHIELLPEPKEVIKDKNTISIFYSWQSDKSSSRKHIWKALESAKKELEKSGKNIVIESDSRGTPGIQDIPNTLFAKIRESDIFVADTSLIGINFYKDEASGLKKIPNPNVMIELGYAAAILGWDRIILIFDSRSNKIEELPFDIRQRSICWYDSAYPDSLNNTYRIH